MRKNFPVIQKYQRFSILFLLLFFFYFSQNAYGIPDEFFCGISLVNETKTCTFSVQSGNYTISITQPYNVFSVAQTNVYGTNISFYFTPTSEQVFFAIMRIKDNSTSEEKSVFIKGEGFSWGRIKINSQNNLGKVFIQDDPTIYFEIENLSELGTAYIISNYSCELTYILPKDKTRCSTKLDYSQEKKSDFSKTFNVLLRIDQYQKNLTFYVYGTWANPEVIIEQYIQFDGILVGRSQTKFAKILNEGNYPLIISGVLDNLPFYVGRVSTSIESEFFLPITFAPVSGGQFSKKITLITNTGFIEITATGTSVMNPLPTLFSEKLTVDFGTLIQGEKRTENIEIFNIGAENLVIKNIYIPPNNAFSIDGNIPTPIIIQPSKSFVIPVVLNPQSEGEFESYIDIESNDPEKVKLRINLYGKSTVPDISATTNIDFGYIRIGVKKRKNIIISNEKFFPFVISSISCSEENGFTIELTTIPRVLNYQETISIPIIFSPTELKKYESECTVTVILPTSSSNYSFESGLNLKTKSVRVNISGYGGYPHISVRDLIDFGEVWSDESKELIFPIENTGDTDLEVKLIIDSIEMFKISAEDIQVRPKEAFPLKIVFSPNGKSGSFSAYIKMFTNDPALPEINVRITAISKAPEVVFEGKGCSSFDKPILLFFFALIFLHRVRILIFSILIVILSGKVVFSMNLIFAPKSGGRLFFTSEPNFYAKETLSLSNTNYISYGQLLKNIYKEKLVNSETLISSSLTNEVSGSYSISDRGLVYASLPVIYSSGKLKGFGLADPFFGLKSLIYEGQKISISSDFFISPPLGNKRIYLQNSPLSSGLIGIFKISELVSNVGVIYSGKEIPLRALLSAGMNLKLPMNLFNGYEGYIIFPLGIKNGFTSSEASTSFGIDLGEFIGKIGLAKGLIGGFGSSGLRIFVSAAVNINTKSNPSVKYFESSVIINDGLGNKIKNCRIQSKKIMISELSPDGEFRLKLPEGTHELEILCEGFEINKTYVSNINPNAKVIMERIEPTLIAYSTDKTGIPLERNIKVKVDESEFEVQTYYIVLRGQRNIKIESGKILKDVFLTEPQFFWMRLEEKKEVEEDSGREILQEIEKEKAEKLEQGRETKLSSTEEGIKAQKNMEIQENPSSVNPEGSGIVKEKLSNIIQRKFMEKFYDIYTEKEGEIVFRFTISGFQLNSASIPPNSQKHIQEIIEFVTKNMDKIKEISIEGHTDDMGTESWNMELSYLRANSVRKLLFEKGLIIPMKIVGYGIMFPLKNSDNPQAKSVNRRVEIKVIMK